MICVFCYAIVHMLARRGKTRSRKPREGHVRTRTVRGEAMDTRWQISCLFFTFAIRNTRSNFPTDLRYAIYKYIYICWNEFSCLMVERKRSDRSGRALNNLEGNRRILVRRITPRFTVIKYRVSSPSRKWHPYEEGDTTSSRVRLLILRQGNKWFDREYEY